MKLPPPIGDLDFSAAHFLDHPWWSCRGGPHRHGGMRGHLKIAWRYKWSEELRAATTCRLGRHRPTQAWQKGRGDFIVCTYCGKPL